jgi:hypothetical protein
MATLAVGVVRQQSAELTVKLLDRLPLLTILPLLDRTCMHDISARRPQERANAKPLCRSVILDSRKKRFTPREEWCVCVCVCVCARITQKSEQSVTAGRHIAAMDEMHRLRNVLSSLSHDCHVGWLLRMSMKLQLESLCHPPPVQLTCVECYKSVLATVTFLWKRQSRDGKY